jgi:ferritin-like metal-binding protein YciE
MKIDTSEKLLEHLLQDLYSAEQQILVALPKMSEAATNENLKDGFDIHLEETRTHVTRLEVAAESLGIRLGGVKCHGMEGLIKEGSDAIENIEEGALRDAALVGGARTVEHYEILKYGMVIMMLEEDDGDIADILKETLKEEEATDKKLSSLITT